MLGCTLRNQKKEDFIVSQTEKSRSGLPSGDVKSLDKGGLTVIGLGKYYIVPGLLVKGELPF